MPWIQADGGRFNNPPPPPVFFGTGFFFGFFVFLFFSLPFPPPHFLFKCELSCGIHHRKRLCPHFTELFVMGQFVAHPRSFFLLHYFAPRSLGPIEGHCNSCLGVVFSSLFQTCRSPSVRKDAFPLSYLLVIGVPPFRDEVFPPLRPISCYLFRLVATSRGTTSVWFNGDGL